MIRLLALLSALLPPAALVAEDSLALWRDKISVRPVLGETPCHSLHAYFNTSPESPDGKHVLLFRSTTPDAHEGQICIVDRHSGEVRVLAAGVTTEDAHRAACQQWICGGREVVFHDLRDGRWGVTAIEIASGRKRLLAPGRQLAWGQPTGETVTLYGPHWDPREHRDLELLNVSTGEIRTVVTAQQVQTAHAEFLQQQFGDQPVSIFFPILSPDERRVFFKLASPLGGDFRSATASRRLGLLCYDLAESRFLPMHPSWGHPAWHADSRHILNVKGQRLIKIDSTTGTVEGNEKLPPVPGAHPSFSPDGRLFVTDLMLEASGEERAPWGVMVGDFASGQSVLLHRLENGRGATSWRRSHPHPAFSPDGRRIYFNVSADNWTRLFVAEAM